MGWEGGLLLVLQAPVLLLLTVQRQMQMQRQMMLLLVRCETCTAARSQPAARWGLQPRRLHLQ